MFHLETLYSETLTFQYWSSYDHPLFLSLKAKKRRERDDVQLSQQLSLVPTVRGFVRVS